jgi:hypothetical protein
MKHMFMVPEYECGIYSKMLAMFREARQQCKKHGSKMEYCGEQTRWTDCFTGFPNGEKYTLLFQYNVGPATYAVQGNIQLISDERIASRG